MRIYLPSTDSFLSGGVDMVERWLKGANFPRALSVTRCDETSAILIELSNGACIEVESGARHYMTGVALDTCHNAKAWLAMAKADWLNYLASEIARLATAIASESGEARKAMQDQIDRYNRKIAIVSGALVSLDKPVSLRKVA